MIKSIKASLSAKLDQKLVDELLAAFEDAKRNYYLEKLRLSEVEGGRFCEAAFRLLQQARTGTFDPIGTSLDTEKTIRELAQTAPGSLSDSIRLHIPRALRMVYDIRNKRDAAHLADGIDPNFQDATLVISTLDWALAEFVRLYHNTSANEAQNIVNSIIERKIPIIEEFSGHLKVLNSDLQASQVCIVLLYQRGLTGATYSQLETWVPKKMKTNLRRTLSVLVHEKALLHDDGSKYIITRSGIAYAEKNRLLE